MINTKDIQTALQVVSEICDMLKKKGDCNSCPFNSLCATYFLCESFVPKTCCELTYPYELKEHLDEYTTKINRVLVSKGLGG